MSNEIQEIEGFKFKDSKAREEIEKINTIITTQPRNKIHGPKYIAHRGASKEAPENTTKAFEIAGNQLFDGCETDIYSTVDDVLVCFHNDRLDEFTNGSGKITEKTYAELQELTIDAGANVDFYPGLKIPTLEEYLDICYAKSMCPVIELKSVSDNALIKFYETVKKYGFEEKCIIISFTKYYLQTLRSWSTKLKIQHLCPLSIENIEYCKSHNFDISTDIQYLTEELVNEAHNNGLEVGAWIIQNPNSYYTCKLYRVDYITTDSISYCIDIHSVDGITNPTGTETFDGIILYNKYEIEKYRRGNKVFDGTYLNNFHHRTFNSNYKFPKSINSGKLDRAIALDLLKIKSDSVVTFFIPEGYKMAIQCYTRDNQYTEDLGWLTGNTMTGFPENTYFGIAYFKKDDESEFTEVDFYKLRGVIASITY